MSSENDEVMVWDDEFTVWDDEGLIRLIIYSGKDDVVKIPEGIKRINNTAFYGKKNIKEIILPESVTEIEELSFAECTNLKKINIPSGVEKIGSLAFFDCVNLEPFDLPETVKEKGKMIFTRCGIPENERTMSFDSRLNLYLEAFDALNLLIWNYSGAETKDDEYRVEHGPKCEGFIEYSFREFYEKFWLKGFNQYVNWYSANAEGFILDFYAFIGAPQEPTDSLEEQYRIRDKADLLDAGLEFIKDRRSGNHDSIFTGLSCIDSVTHGFQKKRLYIVNEDCENSSAFTFTMLQKFGIEQNIKCLLISKKFQKTFVALNLICSGTGIKYNKLLSKLLKDEDFNKIQEFCAEHKENRDSITFRHFTENDEGGSYYGVINNWVLDFKRGNHDKKIVFADGVDFDDLRWLKLTAERYKIPVVVMQHGEERQSEYADAEITFYSHEESSTADTTPYDVKVLNNELLFKGFCASGIVLNRNKGIFEAEK